MPLLINSLGVTKMVKTIYDDQVPVCGLNDRYSGGAINALTGTPRLVDRLMSRWCRQLTGAGSPPPFYQEAFRYPKR